MADDTKIGSLIRRHAENGNLNHLTVFWSAEHNAWQVSFRDYGSEGYRVEIDEDVTEALERAMRFMRWHNTKPVKPAKKGTKPAPKVSLSSKAAEGVAVEGDGHQKPKEVLKHRAAGPQPATVRINPLTGKPVTVAATPPAVTTTPKRRAAIDLDDL